MLIFFVLMRAIKLAHPCGVNYGIQSHYEIQLSESLEHSCFFR